MDACTLYLYRCIHCMVYEWVLIMGDYIAVRMAQVFLIVVFIMGMISMIEEMVL